MSALLFPGQGSQIVGMGSEFYNNFDIVKNEIDKKNNIKKKIKEFKLDKWKFPNPKEVLKLSFFFKI